MNPTPISNIMPGIETVWFFLGILERLAYNAAHVHISFCAVAGIFLNIYEFVEKSVDTAPSTDGE